MYKYNSANTQASSLPSSVNKSYHVLYLTYDARCELRFACEDITPAQNSCHEY